MEVNVIGTGITRFGMFLDTRLRQLASAAADAALADAEISAEDVGLVVFGNAAAGLLTGQEMIRAHTALADSKLAGRPMLSVENACASSSTAFRIGALAIASGEYETVVVVGAEKMTSPDRRQAARALATAVDVELGGSAGAGPLFMEIYAAEARDYIDRTGTSPRDIAAIAAKNASNGAHNPIAQHRTALSADEVLQARMIADPLTRPMCSSIGDGAAAIVLTSPQRAPAGSVRVLACEIGAAKVGDDGGIVARTARAAYERAAVGPEDIDVCEVHDAAASAELLIAEELGLAAHGEAVRLIRDGATLIGGRIPINPSGGLIARGHPVGATGAAQIVELCDQLRGRSGDRQVQGTRIALAENAGGWLGNGPAACVVTILGGD